MAQHGTAAIVIWRPQKVVVGADSMVTRMSSKLPAVSSCKIRHYGRFWLVASGLYGYTPTGYNMWSLAREVLTEAKSASSAADTIAGKVSDPLQVALGQIRLGSPTEYRTAFKAGVFLAFAVIGVELEKVVVARRDFSTEGLLKEDYPPSPNVSPGAMGYFHIGYGDAIEQAYPINSGQLQALLRGSASDVIKKLIQIEIDKEPQNVGPPISILEVTPSGYHWIEEGGACQDATSTRLP